MTDELKNPESFEPDTKEWEQQMEALQAAQKVYIQQAFKWLIDFVTSYFPEDQLAAEDVMTEVHFFHSVIEQGKPLGVLVYRFRKAQDKQAYYAEMREEVRAELGVPEVLFVDTETSRFEAPAALPEDGAIVEIPVETLSSRIRELREELKRRARLRDLRASL